MKTKRYKRSNTNITISLFSEQNGLMKYNYDPPYQRDYNVWSQRQKSFLIDTILKNFPMPPIFLEQKIIEGKTFYDVIDGKQRLNAIIQFINNEFALPKDFGNDVYGTPKLNGKTFDELKKLAKEDQEISDFLDGFWGYVINVEYIDKPDNRVVDNIFDRLNRGGERLNPAELRKAKYYDTIMYQGIVSLKKNAKSQLITRKLDSIRLEDISFLTEIYLLVLSKRIINGVEKDIDVSFKSYVDSVSQKKNSEVVNQINNIFDTFSMFDLDLDKYRIAGTSHLYALLYLAYYLDVHDIDVTNNMKQKLCSFYKELRSQTQDENIMLYSISMQSASKYKHSRRRRVQGLLKYLGYKTIQLGDN